MKMEQADSVSGFADKAHVKPMRRCTFRKRRVKYSTPKTKSSMIQFKARGFIAVTFHTSLRHEKNTLLQLLCSGHNGAGACEQNSSGCSR